MEGPIRVTVCLYPLALKWEVLRQGIWGRYSMRMSNSEELIML